MIKFYKEQAVLIHITFKTEQFYGTLISKSEEYILKNV